MFCDHFLKPQKLTTVHHFGTFFVQTPKTDDGYTLWGASPLIGFCGFYLTGLGLDWTWTGGRSPRGRGREGAGPRPEGTNDAKIAKPKWLWDEGRDEGRQGFPQEVPQGGAAKTHKNFLLPAKSLAVKILINS